MPETIVGLNIRHTFIELSMILKNSIISLRPEQWVKNLFILIPVFFAGQMQEREHWLPLVLALLAFSLMASCVYVLNDYMDRDADRAHPTKKLRPIASGAVNPQQAIFLGLICLIVSILLALAVQLELLWILLAYLLINILYSLRLKHIAIIDITIIASGFLLRIFAGGVVAAVPISTWLIVLTFLLAMLLALGKRRSEFLLPAKQTTTRRALAGYNLSFIDMAMMVLAAVTIVAYLMYTISEEVIERIGSDKIYFTTLFVILGVLRYLQLAQVYNRTASPTKVLLKDHFIQLVLLCWVAAFGYLLYIS